MASRSSSVHSTSFAYTLWVQHFTEETLLSVHEVKKPFICDISDYSCFKKEPLEKTFCNCLWRKGAIRMWHLWLQLFLKYWPEETCWKCNVHEGKKPFIFTKLGSFTLSINNPSKRILSQCALPIWEPTLATTLLEM